MSMDHSSRIGRTDRILAELAGRYGLTERFLVQVRPMVETIFSSEFDSQGRTSLLEELAATCQRDMETRNALDELKIALLKLFKSPPPPPSDQD